MSDHGFGPVYKFVNFNTWLLKQGLLRLKNTPGTMFRYLLFRLGFNYSVLGNWILKLGFGKRTKKMGRAKREDWQRRLFLSLKDIDWLKSKVYSMGNFGQLFVNLEGREPQGIVSPGEEYEAVISDLIRRLEDMVDPDTGERVIQEIMRGEDVYDGPYADKAPDLLFFTRNMEYKAMGLSDFSSNKVFEPVFGTRGHHRMNGILICYGPDVFKEKSAIKNAKIFDLAPTILYLLDQDIPKSMDGQLLLDLFTEEFRADHAIKYSENLVSDETDDQIDLTEKEEEALADILRALGYVN
jgi:predicted AlkP superfamily phosphohydrolase/phosphomutase